MDTSYNNDKEWYEVFKFNFSNAEIEIKFPPALLKNKLASLKIIEYNKKSKLYININQIGLLEYKLTIL